MLAAFSSSDRPTVRVFAFRMRARPHLGIGLSWLALALGLMGCGHATSLMAPPPIRPTPVAHANATLRILVPKHVTHSIYRHPQYVSASTQSISVVINGASPIIFNITPTSPGCQTVSQGVQCTETISAPVGNDTFVITSFDKTGGTGNKLSVGTVTQQIVQGQSNTVAVTLDGIIATIVLALQSNAPPEGATAPIGLTVMAEDADGNTIIGPGSYDNPITLADTDPKGTTTLSTTTVGDPSVAVTLTYNGNPLSSAGANALISASASGVPSSAITDVYFYTAQIDWDTWGFTPYRSSNNTSETKLSVNNVTSLHQIWSYKATTGVFIAAPVVAGDVLNTANGPLDVLYAGDEYGKLYALNAGTGSFLWSKQLQTEYVNPNTGCTDQPNGIYGISSTPQIDRSANRVYVVDGNKNLYAYDLGTGTEKVGPLPLLSGTAQTEDNDYAGLMLDAPHNFLYIGMGAHCGQPNQGGVVQYNTSSGGIRIFWGGGDPNNTDGRDGVWGPGGVVLDPRSVYDSNNNDVFGVTADGPTGPSPVTGNPQLGSAAFRESALMAEPPASYYNVPLILAGDEDFGDSPLVFTPKPSTGCSKTLLVAGNKDGVLFTFDADNIGAGPLQNVAIAFGSQGGQNTPTGAYDPNTGFVFLNNGSDDPNGGTTYKHGLLAFSVTAFCTLNLVWQAVVGPNGTTDGPPAPPTVANGVVYYADGPGSGCSVIGGHCTPSPTDFYAFNAATGGVPLYHQTFSTGPIFAAPIVANGHVYLVSWGGYGPGYVYGYGL